MTPPLTVLAQTFRFFAPKAEPVYIPRLVADIQERYEFVRVPTGANELLIPPEENRPLVFEHGRATLSDGRTIVVDGLRIFRSMIGVNTRTTTDDSDAVLTDMLDWA